MRFGVVCRLNPRCILPIPRTTTYTASEKGNSRPEWTSAEFQEIGSTGCAEHVSWLVTEPDDVAVMTALHNEEGGHRAALVAEYGTVSVFYIAPVEGDNLSQIDLKLVPR